MTTKLIIWGPYMSSTEYYLNLLPQIVPSIHHGYQPAIMKYYFYTIDESLQVPVY